MADIDINELKAVMNLKVVLPAIRILEACDRAGGGEGSGKTKGDLTIEVKDRPDLAVTLRFRGDGIDVLPQKVEKPRVVLQFPSTEAINSALAGAGNKPKIKGILFGLPLLLKFKKMSKQLGPSIREEGVAPGGVKTRAKLLLTVIVTGIAEFYKVHPTVKGAATGLEGITNYGIAEDNYYYHIIFDKTGITPVFSAHPNPTSTISWKTADQAVAMLTKSRDDIKVAFDGDIGFCMNSMSVMGKAGLVLSQAREG